MKPNELAAARTHREPALTVLPGGADAAPASAQQVNILLVDDRSDKLLALEAVLSSLDQNLVKARSGKEALRHLLKQDFAVILLDVSMPEMDGFETAALIRQRTRSAHTPIIFLTSIGTAENDVTRGYALGAVDYLLLPIVPEVLRTKVGAFVELHRQTALVEHQAQQLRLELAARQDAEEEITRLNRQLEQRVAALTEVNHQLETFTCSISHDLRAPLRSIGSFAHALLETESRALTPAGLDLARRIQHSAKYMDALLLDLLAYSRLARTEVVAAPVSLDDVVNEVLAMMDNEIRGRGAQVEVASPLGPALGHLPTLKQVAANLVGNSLKFVAPDRPLRLRIFTTRQPGLVRLWVEDNGIGIAARYHEKIFGLFERLHDTQTYPGTGIGLALVRKGAEQMGGRAGLESEPGLGSRFWVELRAVEGIPSVEDEGEDAGSAVALAGG